MIEYTKKAFHNLKKGLKEIGIFEVLLYLAFFILLVFVISQKVNYHIDEILSYGLANYNKGYLIDLENGVRYEPASEPFIEYLSVQPGNRSNFAMTWANQANDSHPPFYYALVHLFCALKVGVFTKWFAGAINIVFALLTLFVVRRIAELLCDDKAIRNIVSIGFAYNYAIISDVALFRMYFMSMFLVITTAYLVLLQLKKDRGLLFYILITTIVFVGALTHYYCLLFDIFISFAYCVYLLTKKKWKDVLLYCVCMGIAAAATIYVFPPIVRHLFTTGHANDAFNGITMFSEYASRIFVCFKTVNDMLYGGLLYLILPCIIYFAIANKNDENNILYFIAMIPTVLYFLIVAITATYTNERYFTPIYAISYCLIFCFLLSNIKKYITQEKRFMAMGLAVVLLSVSLSYVKAEWPYLYRQDRSYLNKAETYSDTDCICIHNELRLSWEIQLNFNEFIKYKSFTVFDQRALDLEDLNSYIHSDNVIVHLTCVEDEEAYLQSIIDALPQFSNYEVIGGNGNGTSYYLY